MHNYTQHATLRLSGFCGGSELWWHILLQLHRQLICFAMFQSLSPEPCIETAKLVVRLRWNAPLSRQ